MLILRKPWTSQPQGGVRISNGGVKPNLVITAAGANLTRNIAADTFASTTGNMSFGNKSGEFFNWGATSSYNAPSIGFGNSAALAASVSLGIRLVRTGTCSDSGPVLFGARSAAYSLFNLYWVANKLHTSRGNWVSAENSWELCAPALGEAINLFFGFDTNNVAADPFVYVNGNALTPIKTGAVTGTTGNGNVVRRIFDVSNAVTWNFGLSTLQFFDSANKNFGEEWSLNPWQLFEPRRIIIPVSAGAGGGATIAIGQSLETDAAYGLTAPQTLALNLASESNAAQVLTARQNHPLSQPSESDTAQAVAPSLPGVIAAAAETNAAQALVATQVRYLGQAPETDAPQQITPRQARTIGQPQETSSAQSIGSAQLRALEPCAEGNTANPVASGSGAVFALGLALEIDAANALAAAQRKTLTQSAETNAAMPLTAPAVAQDGADTFDYFQLLQAPALAPPHLLRVAQHLQMLRDVRRRGQRKR